MTTGSNNKGGGVITSLDSQGFPLVLRPSDLPGECCPYNSTIPDRSRIVLRRDVNCLCCGLQEDNSAEAELLLAIR